MKEVDLFSRSRRWRTVFAVSIFLRLVFAACTSYIHPDEHFQGPEAVADTVFGWATKKSWEFTSNRPARSFLSIWAMYGLPMSFVELLFGEDKQVQPLAMFYLLRMGFAIGTWVLTDMAIDRLSNSKQDRIKSLVFVASSYVTWVFQSHTFSNSVETVVLLWCLVIIHEFEHARANLLLRHFDTALLGMLIIFGVFNRITFPAFLVLPSLNIVQHFLKNPMTIVSFTMSAALTCGAAIWIDRWMYGFQVIAPLNSILYNMDASNLAEHGIHPRFNHLLVNLPQLLGPGLVMLISKKYIKSLPFQSAMSGLVCLSIIPHQELRFLIPIVPLLCCCFDTSMLSNKMLRGVFAVWAIFNVMLGMLMGVLHQGGVVPAQAYIGQHLAKNASTVIWWKTYSPPIWLLGQPAEDVNVVDPLVTGTDEQRYAPVFDHIASKNYTNSEQMTVVDMMGCQTDWLKNVMNSVSKTSAKSTNLRRAFFVAPDAAFNTDPVLKNLATTKRTDTSYRLVRLWHTPWHMTMESLDFGDWDTLKPGLSIWEMRSV